MKDPAICPAASLAKILVNQVLFLLVHLNVISFVRKQDYQFSLISNMK